LRNIIGDQERIYADCAKSFGDTNLTALAGLRGSQVMVTGATGFVGCWVLSTLTYLNDVHGFGIRIHAVARRPDAIERKAPFLAGRDDISWIGTDIRQLVAIPEGVAWLFHAAGIPDSRHHATNPIETVSVIGEGTLRVLHLAEQAGGLRQILHVSSGLVETTVPSGRTVSPTTAYVEAKRYSETLCYAFRTQAKLPIVITRPYTFLGPFQDLDSPWAANNFLRAGIEGQPLKIRGDGHAVRSYLYGSDMAMIALHQMVRGESGEIYDLGGMDAMTVLDLANLVVGQAQRPLEIRLNTTGRQHDADTLLPDMARSTRQFGIKPAWSVEDAVKRSLAWYS
jgi:dTDP-glucose 4,6-dehydratase